MTFDEIKTWDIFTISDTPTYPKLKIDWGYVDIRDNIRKIWICSFPVRLMTEQEIKIAFYWLTIEEAKDAVKHLI